MHAKWMVVVAAVGALCLAGGGPARADDFKRELVKGALGKSIPLMLTSAETFQARMGKVCASCHHQMIPSVAYDAARQMGFAVDEKRARAQSDFSYRFITQYAPAVQASLDGDPDPLQRLKDPIGDPRVMALPLYAQAVDGRKRDPKLETLALFMARGQAEDGRWAVGDARPPSEGSEFTATAMAVRGIRAYGPESAREELERRVAKAREWLLRKKPKSTEDKAFRLFGLKWSGADEAAIRQAADDLLDDQRDDGGWSQLPNKPSDAYATGEVLVALRESGALPAWESAYQRGAMWLGMTQQKDGSWHVSKRAVAVQPYFESGFPHGKDQYISIMATAWASAAVAYCVEPAPQRASRN